MTPSRKTIAWLLGWLSAALLTATAQEPAAPQLTQLLENSPVEKSLAGGAAHNYGLTLQPGQFLRLVAEQRGIDIVLTLFAPNGAKLREADAPTEAQGDETLSFVAETGGVYRCEVRATDAKAKAGGYVIRLESLRAATTADRQRVAAEQAAVEAERLFDGDTAAKRRALEKYNEALGLWRLLDEPRKSAEALGALGDLHRDLREYPQAAAQYRQALTAWHALQDQSEEAASLNSLGVAANLGGDKLKAIEYFTQALPLRRAAKDARGEVATLNNLAATYVDLGDFHQALEIHQQALSLRRALKDRRGEALTLNNLGAAYAGLGEKRRALDYYRQALQLRRVLNDVAGQAQTLNNLGAAFSDLGEQQQALDAYAQALPLRRAAKDTRGEAITLANLGRAYDLLGAQDEAQNYFNQALPIFRNLQDRLWESRVLNYQGLANWAAGTPEMALLSYEQALPLRRTLQDNLGVAELFNNIGLAHMALGDAQKAVAAYEEALPAARAAGDKLAETRMLNNLGFAYEALGDKTRALAQHQQALTLNREVGDRQREAKIRYGIARIESANNRLNPARDQLEQTIKLVEAQRVKLASPELRASYRAAAQQYYDLYIDVLMRMGKRVPRGITQNKLVAEALQASENARARSLIELLTEANADIRQGADATLIERERALQEKLNDRTTEQFRLLGQRSQADAVARLGKELEQLTAELRDTRTQLRQTSPRYAALTQPEPLSLRALQEQLDGHTLLLEYALGPERSYLWAVTRADLRSFTLPKRAVIESAARRYYELLTARNRLNSSETAPDTQPAARQLSRLLLGPLAAQLGQKRPLRLLIVADGALHYVPFAALPEPLGARPLVVRHEIVNLPSATTLAVLRHETAKRPRPTQTAAVFADPVFEVQDERVKTVTLKAAPGNAQSGNAPQTAPDGAPTEISRVLLKKAAHDVGAADTELRLPRLPSTRAEAETILQLATPAASKGAFDFAATRAAALAEDLGQYRILHFATHGFLNSLNPELSGLVLALVDEQGQARNGYLLAPELYNLKLSATELVVLSACQTGLGKEVRGEGLIGLTRGFMYAGAPRVVVSLWSVSDSATAELMKNFYQAMLAQGQTPAAALRAAQLAILRNPKWQAPYFWAAFGLQGDWH